MRIERKLRIHIFIGNSCWWDFLISIVAFRFLPFLLKSSWPCLLSWTYFFSPRVVTYFDRVNRRKCWCCSLLATLYDVSVRQTRQNAKFVFAFSHIQLLDEACKNLLSEVKRRAVLSTNALSFYFQLLSSRDRGEKLPVHFINATIFCIALALPLNYVVAVKSVCWLDLKTKHCVVLNVSPKCRFKNRFCVQCKWGLITLTPAAGKWIAFNDVQQQNRSLCMKNGNEYIQSSTSIWIYVMCILVQAMTWKCHGYVKLITALIISLLPTIASESVCRYFVEGKSEWESKCVWKRERKSRYWFICMYVFC